MVGVMPAHFSFPTQDEELWLPARLPAQAFEDRNDNFLEVVGQAEARRDDRRPRTPR